MTYRETLSYLFSQLPMYHRIGATAYKADLSNTIKLCNIFGHPQDHFPSVHIAGTNGKGSVSHMLASILAEKGLKVGLFTSPHLKDFRERIRVNGKMIPKSWVTGFVNRNKNNFSKIQPSFFEMTAALAFSYFSTEKVDIAVIEVGLGGRLDSTNVITPLISVITNISFDHMQFLGESLEQIAAEKAGIIKPSVPVVIGETQDQTKKVFLDKAIETCSEIIFADQIFHVEKRSEIQMNPHPPSSMKHRKSLKPEPLIVDIYRGKKIVIENLISPLSGNYQMKNITTVAGICELLNQKGFKLSNRIIRNGIEKVISNTGLLGRWQILSHRPLTICDTGHNEGGIRQVVSQINTIPHDHLHFILGVVNDKDISTILSLLPKNATYYFCKADIPRGLPADELKMKAILVGLQGDCHASVKEAYKSAKAIATSRDLIFIGGSTFVVAEVI